MNVAFLYALVLKGKGFLIVVWNSQICEEIFRTLRSMTPAELTQINFTLLEALEKLNRVAKIHEIASNYKEVFEFKENLKMRSDIDASFSIRTEPPSEEDCHKIIANACNEAKKICKTLGMKNFAECDPESFFKSSDEPADNIEQYLLNAYGEQEEQNLEPNELVLEREDVGEAGKKVIKIKNMFFVDDKSGTFLKTNIKFKY